MENLESTEILERLSIVNKEIILDIEQIYDLQSWIVKFDIEHQYFEFRSKHVL